MEFDTEDQVLFSPFFQDIHETLLIFDQLLTLSRTKHRLVDTWNSDTLEIHRVRREDMGAYLCIANNDVPPAVSRRIYLHVQCKPDYHVSNSV